MKRNIPTLSHLQKSEVMKLQLKAMHVWMKKDTVATERLLKQATDMEIKSSYAYGPPSVVKPSTK